MQQSLIKGWSVNYSASTHEHLTIPCVVVAITSNGEMRIIYPHSLQSSYLDKTTKQKTAQGISHKSSKKHHPPGLNCQNKKTN